MPDLVGAADLADLHQTKKRSYVIGTDLAAAAAEINELFGWYALWAAGQHAGAPRHEVRDWCRQVAKQAGDLTFALGLDRRMQRSQHGDALLHLSMAWPYLGGASEREQQELYARDTLDRLAREAQPELFNATHCPGGIDPEHRVAEKCIGPRLAAALGVLQLLATRAGDYHAGRVRKAGIPQKARKGLFCDLAGAYERLFGCLPGAPSHTRTTAEKAAGVLRCTLPKGPALTWHRELLGLIGAKAGEMLPIYVPDGPSPNADLTVLLGELMNLAAAAEKGKAADGLAHWINDGRADWTRKPPKLLSGADDPDFTPTPLKELLE